MSTVLALICVILGARLPSKILGTVIPGVPVHVSDFLAVGTRTVERLAHCDMCIHAYATTIYLSLEGSIAGIAYLKSEQLARLAND